MTKQLAITGAEFGTPAAGRRPIPDWRTGLDLFVNAGPDGVLIDKAFGKLDDAANFLEFWVDNELVRSIGGALLGALGVPVDVAVAVPPGSRCAVKRLADQMTAPIKIILTLKPLAAA
jgi:hypothetical protein